MTRSVQKQVYLHVCLKITLFVFSHQLFDHDFRLSVDGSCSVRRLVTLKGAKLEEVKCADDIDYILRTGWYSSVHVSEQHVTRLPVPTVI